MKSCKLRYFNLFEFFDCTANFRVFVRIRPQLFASKSYVLTETVVKKTTCQYSEPIRNSVRR
jgi:hypothetical protein